jgi:hypothetical protein
MIPLINKLPVDDRRRPQFSARSASIYSGLTIDYTLRII